MTDPAPDKFVTLPLCLLNALEEAHCGRGLEKCERQEMLGPLLIAQKKFSGIATMEESREIALSLAQGEELVFLKEGHTSSVWRARKYVINVSRDASDAYMDLKESTDLLHAVYGGGHIGSRRIARVVNWCESEGYFVAIMQFIDHSRELTLLGDLKTFAAIEKFNGLGAPTQEVMNPVVSKMIMDQINAIEDDLGITVSVLHGDVVFVFHSTPDFPDGRCVAVACDSPNREVFTPYRHREVFDSAVGV